MDADICAPCSAAFSAKAMLPPRRWSAGASPDSAPIVRLRLAPSTSGQPSEWNSARPFISSRLWRDILAEAEAGIDQDPIAVDPRLYRGGDPLLEPDINLDQHVVVARIVLHRSGAPWWCIRTTGHAGGGDDLGRAVVIGQRGDIVDHPRAGLQRCRHDVSLARVGRNRGSARRELADDGRDARDLVAFPHRFGARPRRFAADVDDRRALAPPCRRRPPRPPRDHSNCPPSEKLSGVTLTMPITCGWSSWMVRSPS